MSKALETALNSVTELKPCPFCGGRPDTSSHLNGYVVCCVDCNPEHAVERCGRTKEEAVAAWNTRTKEGSGHE